MSAFASVGDKGDIRQDDEARLRRPGAANQHARMPGTDFARAHQGLHLLGQLEEAQYRVLGLSRKSHATDELRKARVGAHAIPPRIEAQPHQPVRLVDRREGRLVLAEAGMHQGNAVGRHEFPRRQALHFG